MKIKLFIIASCLLMGLSTYSQELNARVQISAQQLQGNTNRQVFSTLQKALFEFLNGRKWTNNVFSADERIECTFQINISQQVSSDRYKGTLQIQANRPVYGTNLNSVMLNYRDQDIEFEYVEHQSLEFNESTHTNNLMSIIAYWAYIIIGLDYDSFSPMGGTPFFTKAEAIVNNAQNAREKGWKSFEGQKNRYWIIQNLLDSKYGSVRNFYYTYHRHGLDKMMKSLPQGRTKVMEGLRMLQKVYREKPSPFMPILQITFDAKADEFINVFSEAPMNEKNMAYNILVEINPSNTNKYQRMKEQKR